MSEKFFGDGNESVYIEVLIFILGGAAYGLLETLFRGYTHWTMVLTGGACVLTLYLLEDWLLSMNLVIAAIAWVLSLILGWDGMYGIIHLFPVISWVKSALPLHWPGSFCALCF